MSCPPFTYSTVRGVLVRVRILPAPVANGCRVPSSSRSSERVRALHEPISFPCRANQCTRVVAVAVAADSCPPHTHTQHGPVSGTLVLLRKWAKAADALHLLPSPPPVWAPPT
uniref:Uncharacterized protein n=1 Tax=Oryza meridionalis TaxID=40149 RepID=A0A0E0CW96_9ORYZ